MDLMVTPEILVHLVQVLDHANVHVYSFLSIGTTQQPIQRIEGLAVILPAAISVNDF